MNSPFSPDDFVIDDVEVWPENWPAFALFCDMQTQWRMGFGGPTGLDYGVLLRELMPFHDVHPDVRRAMFIDIQVMEAAALKRMSKKFT